MRHVVIAGCGDLGTRLGLRLTERGVRVTGLRRSAGALPAAISGLSVDLASPASLDKLPRDCDTLVYSAAADQRTESAYQRAYVEGLANVLQALQAAPVRRVLFVSSTAVYGQNDASWVDEHSPCQPTAFNGSVMLEAEALLAKQVETTICARLSGIYGPGRQRMIERARSGAACIGQPPSWANRIHVDDAARALLHLLELAQPAPVYLITDSRPSTDCEVMDWLSARLKLPQPPRRPGDAAARGKRLSNRRLLESGFSLQYPDFRSGYGAILDGMAIAGRPSASSPSPSS